MAIPPGVARCSLTGNFGAGDIFDVSFWADGVTMNSNADAAAAAATLAAAALSSGAKAPLQTCLGTNDAWTGASVYCYPTGGPTATYIGHASIAAMLGTSAVNGPLQNSLVATYITATAGRRHTGRSYLPYTGFLDVGSGNNVAPSALSTLLAGWVSMLNAFMAANSGAAITVVSSKGSSQTHVTQVRMDSKVDTQRRRSNRQHALTTAISAV
jgi:hypothetical protein